ncbi:UNVERIFIED_CONTAM: hypothetical protein GTU68_049575 [Idotea baltica]|nr:hypothetical protein [Idotea baltica]
MKTKLRYTVWILLACFYIAIIIIIYVFRLPLKSQSSVSSQLKLLKQRNLIVDENHPFVLKYAEKLTKEKTKKRENTKENHVVLANTFKKANENGDEFLDMVELIAWIAKRIREHLTQALRDNIFIFTAIDLNPRNGVVSWEEYLLYFLKNKGYNKTFIEEHMSTMKGMERDTKESIMREKAAWSQAVRDDPLNLSLDEFLAFRHPESSHASLISIVEEDLAKLDLDEDGALSESEFADPELNDVPQHLTDEQFKEKRIKDFRNIVDKDENGKAERKELLDYYNPKNIHHAEREATDLMNLADVDGDRRLSLAEILLREEEFMRSKMVDVSISFHDEF